MSTHEAFIANHEIKGSSDRNFGLVFAAVFTLLALAPLRHHEPVRLWALVAAAAFGIAALVFAKWLAPLNKAWMKVGLVLQKIVNPVVMAMLFYGLVTPFGVVRRLMGKDSLKRRFDPNAQTYWVSYSSEISQAERMRNQF